CCCMWLWLTLSSCMSFDVFFFFFFQAEDGIRDSSVTGVQTCALPISTRCVAPPRPMPIDTPRSVWPSDSSDLPFARSAAFAHCRSEERRVGKECRSRWSQHD